MFTGARLFEPGTTVFQTSSRHEMKAEKHVARTQKIIKAYKILLGKSKRIRPFGNVGVSVRIPKCLLTFMNLASYI
jgi:hypothetical protein